MGRHLGFNREKALQAALLSFWHEGYSRTSMRDIADKLGIHLGSVYNSLGGKQQLFGEVLDLYIQQQLNPTIQKLETATDPLEAIGSCLATAVSQSTNPSKPSGCLLINTILELSVTNDNITNQLRDCLQNLEDAFSDCVSRGQKKGQIRKDLSAKQCGQFIVATLFSICTISKLGVPKDHIRSIKICAMKTLAA